MRLFASLAVTVMVIILEKAFGHSIGIAIGIGFVIYLGLCISQQLEDSQ